MSSWKKALVRVFNGHPFNASSAYQGSSFLISDRHLLTCKHVVEQIAPTEIFLLGDAGAWEGGGVRRVDEPQYHPVLDVAMLPLKKPTHGALVILPAKKIALAPGDKVILAGFTAGDRSLEIAELIISGYDGNYDLDMTHTKIQKGMSGGPAMLNDELVGITRASEDAHTLVIPVSAFHGFVSAYVGDTSDRGHNSTRHYDTAAIRRLLTDALSDEALCELCMDYFRPVYEQYSVGMSKSQKIQRLIEHCSRHRSIPKLLDVLRQANPAAFAAYEGE